MGTIDKVMAEKEAKIKMPGNYFGGDRFIPLALAEDIMMGVHFKTLKGNDKIYRYHEGVYKDDGKEKIKEVCMEFLGEDFSIRRVNEVIACIQAKTYTDPTEIDNGWVNLENGLLDPITREFKEHTPDIFSIIRIPIEYDPEADCPLFKKELKQKTSENLFKTTQEMFGYCYLPGQRFERAFLLHGPKRTMKSTTLYILGKMLGSDNVKAIPLQDLSDDRFAVAYLYGIPANICPELESKALKSTGTFMAITGGDKIDKSQKHKDPISWYPSTKLIFSCNDIPATYNKNLAFYRRWLPMKFNKQTPKDEIDTKMKGKLLEELPGILNWALEGLERLLKEDDFTIKYTDEEIKDIYERHSDSISSFIFNNIDCEHDEGTLTKRETYAAYIEYCKTNEITPENVIKFGRMFKANTGCGTRRIGEMSLPAYSGVMFKKEVDDLDTV